MIHIKPLSKLNIINIYTKEDNNLSNLIYNVLYKYACNSQKKIPLSENIVLIFFIDIMKLITGSMLRYRELENDMFINTKDTWAPLNNWPYLGYADIKNGIDLDSKNYGRSISIYEKGMKHELKRKIHELLSLTSKIKQSKSVHVSLSNSCLSSGGLSKNIVMKFYKKGINFDWASDTLIESSMVDNLKSQIDSQLNMFKPYINEIADTVRLPFSASIYHAIIRNHISATLEKIRVGKKVSGDALILSSGNELTNRLLSSAAIQNKIHVINIAHGESFGVQDNPLFSMGERLFGNAILGYGNNFVTKYDEVAYKIPNQNKNKYISGTSNLIKRIYNNKKNIKHDIKGNIFYFPTRLRGNNYRYGPYQDCPDYLYLSWQKSLIEIFKKKLIIKAHPKETNSNLFNVIHESYITDNLIHLIDQVDVFIFDFIGTGFSYAAATDKPIIFFDIGIQKFTPSAYDAISKRAITINISNHTNLSYENILDMAKVHKPEYTFTELFCLSNDGKTREDKLVEYLVDL